MQRIIFNVFFWQGIELLYINEVNLQGICQKAVIMGILSEMKYCMEIIYAYSFKVYYIDCYYISELAVIASLVQAACKLPAPIEKAPPVHISIISELNFNVDPCAVFRYCTDIKYAGLVFDHLRCKCPVLYNFNPNQLLSFRFCQNSIQQR